MDDGARARTTRELPAGRTTAGWETGRRVRVALVGAGLVGQAGHVISLVEDADKFDLVAIVDPSATVRAAVARGTASRTPRPTSTRPWRFGLDAVVVAVPDAAHRDVCVAALAAGLHVFCEKPLARQPAGRATRSSPRGATGCCSAAT